MVIIYNNKYLTGFPLEGKLSAKLTDEGRAMIAAPKEMKRYA